MQGFPVSRSTVSPVTTLRTRTMPTPQVSRAVVMQPVNLRPLGNTVSMSVREENPFTAGRPIRVVTQASGGMAKADPAMRTQARFLPIGGLGDLGSISLADEAYSAFNQTDPDAANMTRAQYNASPKRTYWEGEVSKWRAAKSAETASNWSKVGDIFATTVGAAGNISSDINKTKQLALQAQIADANKRQAEIQQATNAAFTGRLLDVSQYGAGMAARKNITIPLLVIGGGALAVALFLFMKKKRTA